MIILYLITIIMSICDGDRRVITTLKYSRYYIKPLVVNGTPASLDTVPYLVSLKKPDKLLGVGRQIWTNLCGGSIISETKVLTAAHCFEPDDFYYNKHPDVLRVVAGNLRTDLEHSGKTETTNEGQWRSIAKLNLHKNFHFPTDDIALIIVDVPWNFTKNVDYIQPASRTTDYSLSTCYSAGYGLTNHSLRDSTPKVLMVAKIDPMPRLKCSFVWQVNMDDFVCTQSIFTDVARGDSGGPLACSGTQDPEEKLGRDILVGVVSGKNFDKTTLFTRLSRYRKWMDPNQEKAISNKLKISCYLLAITLLILIYLLFHWLPLIIL